MKRKKLRKEDGIGSFAVCFNYLEINLRVTYSKYYPLRAGAIVSEIQVIFPYLKYNIIFSKTLFFLHQKLSGTILILILENRKLYNQLKIASIIAKIQKEPNYWLDCALVLPTSLIVNLFMDCKIRLFLFAVVVMILNLLTITSFTVPTILIKG